MDNYALLITELRPAMNLSQEDFDKLLGVAAVSISKFGNGHSKQKNTSII